MKNIDIALSRLVNQQIATSKFSSLKEIAGWMGALQAQDFAMSKWAFGVRLPWSTEKTVNEAVSSGEIIRTHLLRPTWHFVSADNIRWMLELTASRIRASMKSRHRELELDDQLLSKCNSLIYKWLNGKSLTREELLSSFKNAGIRVDNNRASHILAWSELSSVICSGATDGKKHTYALLDDRVPGKSTLSREEALAKLAEIYFRSHGPATIKDFEWWSGLTSAEARKALESVRSELSTLTVDSYKYWFREYFDIPENNQSAFLLPAYDEFIISYIDRSASLEIRNHRRAVSENGLFRPVIVSGGKVVGLWKRTIKKETGIVETEFFQKPKRNLMKQVERCVEEFGKFLGKETKISENQKTLRNKRLT